MDLTLKFGALAPPIAHQISAQGMRCATGVDAEIVQQLQKDADAITRLGRLHLSVAERDRMRRIILKKIARCVRPKGREGRQE